MAKIKTRPVGDKITGATVEHRVRKAQQLAGDGDDWEYSQPAVMQRLIDSGAAWSLEGSCGRAAMEALESGACFLPTEPKRDYWGNTVPSRFAVQAGTKGSLENSARFYGV
jgi:hypothetical protein